MPVNTPPAIAFDAMERDVRQELADLYRLIAHFRMTDLIDTHISAKVPESTNHFLINQYGVLFHEMRADSLVKVDIDGNPVEDAPDPTRRVNAAGFTIHSAIHAARHDLMCVIHTHTADGIAVSMQKEGLQPLSQHALKFYNRLGYHSYEGVALDWNERARLVADLGQHSAMILRNHGLLAGGRTIAEAFVNIYYLERACQAQIKGMSGGLTLTVPSAEVCEHTARQFETATWLAYCARTFEAARRLLDD